MMVTFVSQCEKKALNRTRRVLDTFANRIGNNTWQTVITQDGLLAVKKLLRKTASKNTAVSCHWIRSRARSDLMWIVGKRNKFNNLGIVPVNHTSRNLIHQEWENNWPYLPAVKALTAIAALLHDWGKATLLFQEKLKSGTFLGDPLRHEWISCLLFSAVVQGGDNPNSDAEWIEALKTGSVDEENITATIKKAASATPLSALPPIASFVAWLILTHHRLPNLRSPQANNWRGMAAETLQQQLGRITKEWGYENRYDEGEYLRRVKDCFEFPEGLLNQSDKWLKALKKWALRLDQCRHLLEEVIGQPKERLLLNHCRLALMLGDHKYSSLSPDPNWRTNYSLTANTKNRAPHQKLDEHLVGVASHAVRTAHLLPSFETEFPTANGIARLKHRSPQRYRWQDTAVANIQKWRSTEKEKFGFFCVNMASTGCGKTLANAKLMQALSKDRDSLRYALALGLRTLTLQTGDEYREKIGLDNGELAVVLGSQAIKELHELSTTEGLARQHEADGAESRLPLLEEDVDYDCAIPEEALTTVVDSKRDQSFLYAPILACTIDHLMSATEATRGGKYILPTLRLMSSDLVIDEIDDFTGDDLIAIGRLVHLAGMLGRKVMLSSATIPPDLAEGYYNAYRTGWLTHCKFHNAQTLLGCAWVDEFSTQVKTVEATASSTAIDEYRAHHKNFVESRLTQLQKQPIKRKAKIARIAPTKGESYLTKSAFFSAVQNNVIELHCNHNTIDPLTHKRVSFGVVRVAHIDPCVDLTKFLLQVGWPNDTEVRVMAYHSRQTMLLRHVQEQHLDAVLKRNKHDDPNTGALNNPIVRQHLNAIAQPNVIFILVATPVEEVGRDHDFDWAVIEPSSFRSFIQLLGRLLRHRAKELLEPNASLMQFNLAAIRNSDGPVFLNPGYESTNNMLESHDLFDLIDPNLLERIDAKPRIKKPDQLVPTKNLVDLEHHVTKSLVASYDIKGPESLQGWVDEYWWLTGIPQTLSTFRKSAPNVKLHLVLEGTECQFAEKDKNGEWINREPHYLIRHQPLNPNLSSKLWLHRNYETSLEAISESQQISKRHASIKYGEIRLPENSEDFVYCDQLGLRRNLSDEEQSKC